MNQQLQAALVRAIYVVGGMIGAGLVAILPELTSGHPLDRSTLIRLFVGGAVGAIAGRFGEGVTDARRAAKIKAGHLSSLHPSDVGYEYAKREVERLAIQRNM